MCFFIRKERECTERIGKMSKNFSDLLEDLRMNTSYTLSLLENYILCAVGSVWLFVKFGKKNY